MPKIKIDEREFEVETISDAAKAQLESIRYCDSELKQLQVEVATFQTARLAYISALKEILDSETKAAQGNDTLPQEKFDSLEDSSKTQKKKSKGLKGLFSL